MLFKTKSLFWKILDEAEESGILDETKEEMIDYERLVREEIQQKRQLLQDQVRTVSVDVRTGNDSKCQKLSCKQRLDSAREDEPDEISKLVDQKELSNQSTFVVSPLAFMTESGSISNSSQLTQMKVSTPDLKIETGCISEALGSNLVSSTPLSFLLKEQNAIESKAVPFFVNSRLSDNVVNTIVVENERDFAEASSSVGEKNLLSDMGPSMQVVNPTNPLPSFRQSQFAQTSTPNAPNATLPHVPTPSLDHSALVRHSETPAKSLISKNSIRSQVLDTPEYISSPADTPDHTGPSRCLLHPSIFTVGRTTRNDSATPIGKTLKQSVSKYWLQFARAYPAPANEKGKGRRRRTSKITSARSSIFQGLRFCYPVEGSAGPKYVSRWTIIAEHSGVVTMTPDTATTHIIYDNPNPTVSKLSRILGIDALSQLPEGTEIVRWDWVILCQMTNKVEPTDSYRTFRSNSFTNIQLVGNINKPKFSILVDPGQIGRSRVTRKRSARQSDTESDESQPTKRHRSLGIAARINSACRQGLVDTKTHPSKLRRLDNLSL
ncbi:hypothetical protein L204_106189 [Cryptococcus depauperatus]